MLVQAGDGRRSLPADRPADATSWAAGPLGDGSHPNPASPTTKGSRLHHLTGSPQKRHSSSPKALAPLAGAGGPSGPLAVDGPRFPGGEDWWKTRPFSFTAT